MADRIASTKAIARPTSPPAQGNRAGAVVFFTTLVVTLALFGYQFWIGYQASRREALTTVNNLVGMLTTDVESILDRAQSDLREFVPQITATDLAGQAGAARRADIEARMGARLRSFPAVINYRVFDAGGQTVFGAGSANPHAVFSVADRAWFRQLRDEPERDLAFSDVVVGKGTNDQTIILAVAIRGEDRRFLGAINAAINLSHIQTLVDGLDIGAKGMVAVRRSDDSRLVLRRPQLLDQLNAPVRQSGGLSSVMATRASGDGEFVSSVDNVDRSYAFRALTPYPFGVIVGVAADDYLVSWRKQTLLSGSAALALTAILLLAYRRQQLARARLASFTEALRLSEDSVAREAARFRQLLLTASDGIHILDAAGNLVLASGSFYRMLGYDEDAPPSLHVADWDARFERAEIPALIARLIAAPETFRTRHRHQNGTLIDVEIHSRGVELDGRQFLYASSRDVTERNRVEDKLRETNAELEQFAYVASHDLRQPLRMVSSYLGLIERRLGPRLTDDIKEFLDFAIGGAKSMDRLILDLLEYSRSGKAGESKPVALDAVLAQALATLEVAIREADADITVAAGLPTVTGDATELTRLFQNLIGNAVKYRSPERRPQVDVSVRRQGRDWLLAVRDNGIGIAAQDRDRAFAIFQRLVPQGQYEGSGIGLAVCKKIVEHHGGRIWIESEPGSGSTFFLTLPA